MIVMLARIAASRGCVGDQWVPESAQLVSLRVVPVQMNEPGGVGPLCTRQEGHGYCSGGRCIRVTGKSYTILRPKKTDVWTEGGGGGGGRGVY